MGREELLLEVLPPLDWDRVGTETWGDVFRQIRKIGTATFIRSLFKKDKIGKAFVWERVFKPIRQPEWWGGDALYHPPAYDEPVSELERKLKNGEFVITSEISPPLGAGAGKLRHDIEMVKDFVTAINFTDNSSASPRMSSMACCKVAHDLGAGPVLQVAARERTRSGLQADIVGANEIGIRNVLCISGDSPMIGPTPFSQMNILDIDSVQMLWILRKMRDEGKYLDGREMKNRPRLFLGAAASPFASEPKFQAIREHKKINAGAQFFETNLIFDADRLDLWLEQLYKRDILNKVYILAGITSLRSCKMAYYLHNRIPGVTLPDKILKRMDDAGDGAHEEGIQIALELIEALKQKQGINGIHIMAVTEEGVVPRLVTEGGLGMFRDV